MRILLIEDDPMIGESVQYALRKGGDVVDWATDGRAGELSLQNGVYDLVVLDLGLPRKDGMTVLDQYRAGLGLAPVLIITARDGVDDRIAGLDAGADDYLVKPFDINELKARVRALLRRRLGQTHATHRHRGLLLDPRSHEASLDSQPLNLLPREFALLRALIEQPQKVFSRSELEEKLYGWGDEVGSNAIEVHIHALRKKIGAQEIVTVRGVGYRLARPS